MARDPEKSARRAQRRAQRRAIAASRDPAADASRIAAHVAALADELGLAAGAVVTSYVAVPGEPPTAALNAALAERGIRVLVPVTLPGLDLDWADLEAVGAVGDDEGAAARTLVVDDVEERLGTGAVALADLVLAPGLTVDRHGTRMGQGGGCYDRALPRRRPGTPVVVVLHPGELLDADAAPLPTRPHDQPVDAVVTADGLVDLGLTPWRRSPPAAG